MEKIANKLAHNISLSLGFDDEKEAVVAYGLIAIIQITVIVLLVLFFGILISAPVEGLIVCFSASILRKYSGGAHAAHAPSADGAACVATADANGCSSGDWIHALFAGHGPAECQLLDQLHHALAGPPEAIELPQALPAAHFALPATTAPRAIPSAAHFDARAPPALAARA